jgi:hypothetical protein
MVRHRGASARLHLHPVALDPFLRQKTAPLRMTTNEVDGLAGLARAGPGWHRGLPNPGKFL